MVALSQANSITISIFYFVSTVLTWPSIWKFLHMTCNLCPSCLTLSTPFSSSVEWETEFYGTERLTKTKKYTSHKYPNWSKILCRQNWSFWQKQFVFYYCFWFVFFDSPRSLNCCETSEIIRYQLLLVSVTGCNFYFAVILPFYPQLQEKRMWSNVLKASLVMPKEGILYIVEEILGIFDSKKSMHIMHLMKTIYRPFYHQSNIIQA